MEQHACYLSSAFCKVLQGKKMNLHHFKCSVDVVFIFYHWSHSRFLGFKLFRSITRSLNNHHHNEQYCLLQIQNLDLHQDHAKNVGTDAASCSSCANTPPPQFSVSRAGPFQPTALHSPTVQPTGLTPSQTIDGRATETAFLNGFSCESPSPTSTCRGMRLNGGP